MANVGSAPGVCVFNIHISSPWQFKNKFMKSKLKRKGSLQVLSPSLMKFFKASRIPLGSS